MRAACCLRGVQDQLRALRELCGLAFGEGAPAIDIYDGDTPMVGHWKPHSHMFSPSGGYLLAPVCGVCPQPAACPPVGNPDASLCSSPWLHAWNGYLQELFWLAFAAKGCCESCIRCWPQAERGEVRERAQLLITNPDMLHCSILPVHRQFGRLLRHLHYVVVDEGHAYRCSACTRPSALLQPGLGCAAGVAARPERWS